MNIPQVLDDVDIAVEDIIPAAARFYPDLVDPEAPVLEVAIQREAVVGEGPRGQGRNGLVDLLGIKAAEDELLGVALVVLALLIDRDHSFLIGIRSLKLDLTHRLRHKSARRVDALLFDRFAQDARRFEQPARAFDVDLGGIALDLLAVVVGLGDRFAHHGIGGVFAPFVDLHLFQVQHLGDQLDVQGAVVRTDGDAFGTAFVAQVLKNEPVVAHRQRNVVAALFVGGGAAARFRYVYGGESQRVAVGIRDQAPYAPGHCRRAEPQEQGERGEGTQRVARKGGRA